MTFVILAFVSPRGMQQDKGHHMSFFSRPTTSWMILKVGYGRDVWMLLGVSALTVTANPHPVIQVRAIQRQN